MEGDRMMNKPQSRHRATIADILHLLAVAVLLGLLLFLVGCDGKLEIVPTVVPADLIPPCPQQDPNKPSPYKVAAPVDLPREFRQSNYAGGSCMHAALIPLLRWQDRPTDADWWRRNEYGAAGVWDLARIAERRGLKYAYTTDGNANFLDWCSRTRRGAAIHY